MLFDPARHEALQTIAWNEDRVREAIAWVVELTEQEYDPQHLWRAHPRDLDPGDDPAQPATCLYYGAAGVIWALHHLQALGAAKLQRNYLADLAPLRALNRAWLEGAGSHDHAAYLMGDMPLLMMAHGHAPSAERADALAALISGNIDHPARELMWGSPGTLLAALFLHQDEPASEGDARWAALFQATAARLWDQLRWSDEHGCAYWTQDLYGRQGTYLDAVHGFVATASVLIRGRHLLPAGTWPAWQAAIVNTITRTATREGPLASWRATLLTPAGASPRWLMQFCHGAPGFVICLADMPGTDLDELLIAGGEATWTAGPLTKGSNLCHGTGGNGYAFLKLYRRTGNTLWLERARAFAMHGIAQMQADWRQHGQLRHSLWTGDPGFAIYLWDCLHGSAQFPTLDVFWP